MEPIILAVIVLILAFFAIAGFLILRFKSRELQHRERMVALERGAPLPAMNDLIQDRRAWRPTALLLRGMMWLFSGISLMAFLLAMAVSGHKDLPASVRVQNANYAKNSGATEEQVREIMNERHEQGLPAGFSLIGLIPIGVGLAYLITYRKENELRIAS
jgi:hypothetical protein